MAAAKKTRIEMRAQDAGAPRLKKAAMPPKKGAPKKGAKKTVPAMPKYAGTTGSFSGGSTRGSEGGEG